MNALDYVVLLGTLIGIAAYGIWRTRDRRTLSAYLRGDGRANWITIGLSVMATQASAITFMSTPGQGYQSGLGFVQNYFGLPFALLVVALVFLPLFRKLDVYTAYEFLGKRFDSRTRLLGAGLFLLQRGLGAGITIYAPAIVLSAVFGWRLDMTILCSGLVVIVYTTIGGTDAVSITQKYQMGVIFAGMAAALGVVVYKLTRHASLGDVFAVAGGMGKMQAVDFSLDVHKRYTFWSGLFGGVFLSLAYFGTDQSQVQRYLSGKSLRESRLGLYFNAVVKIPMQYLILLLGVLVFVFYQFMPAPIVFNQASWDHALAMERSSPSGGAAANRLEAAQSDYTAARKTEEQSLSAWLAARHTLRRLEQAGSHEPSDRPNAPAPGATYSASASPVQTQQSSLSPPAMARGASGHKEGDETRAAAEAEPETLAAQRAAVAALRDAAVLAQQRVESAHERAIAAMRAVDPRSTSNDADYVFVRFVVDQLPHGLVGLLIAVFFAAALSSKAAELNALGSTTTVDIYRHLRRKPATEAHDVRASKLFTVLWGLAALGFALAARLAENLIQAVNILGSLFYGVMLGLFLVAFFFRRIGGAAVFWAAIAAEILVITLFLSLDISYLWYNLIGCVACVGLAALLQLSFARR